MSDATNGNPWFPWFTFEELRCSCFTCSNKRANGNKAGFNAEKMDPEFMGHLVAVRMSSNLVMPVSSAYRCVGHREEADKRQRWKQWGWPADLTGTHNQGLAVDILCHGEHATKILQAVMEYNAAQPEPVFRGIGVSQKGPKAARFIHLDGAAGRPYQPRPTIWSY